MYVVVEDEETADWESEKDQSYDLKHDHPSCDLTDVDVFRRIEILLVSNGISDCPISGIGIGHSDDDQQ
jgi:hypothetical protein